MATTRLEWFGRDVKAAVRSRGMLNDLRRAGEYVGERSDATAPHLTGHMVRTRRVTPLDDTAVAISYDTPYAVRQHEDTRLRHAQGRRAKWLELTLQEEERRVVDWIGDAVERRL